MPNNSWNDDSVYSGAEMTGPPGVFCDTCAQEVPLSEAVVPEAVDYVVYFYGLDCYERWRAQTDFR
jgi:hypothetical protein